MVVLVAVGLVVGGTVVVTAMFTAHGNRGLIKGRVWMKVTAGEDFFVVVVGVAVFVVLAEVSFFETVIQIYDCKERKNKVKLSIVLQVNLY